MKKKKINEGLRGFHKQFVSEKELEENIKEQINTEINKTKKKI